MALITCQACGLDEHAELIAAKPSRGDWSGGYDRFECIACYGPGWAPLCRASIAKSVRPALRREYAAWLTADQAKRLSVAAIVRTAITLREQTLPAASYALG